MDANVCREVYFVNSDDLVHAARDIAPRLRERASETELNRALPEITVKELQEAKLFKALQPKRYAGFELPPTAFYEAAMVLAAACGSTGWVYGVVGVHNWQLGLFPEDAQDEVWGDDVSMLVASSYAPTGQVERVDGGFRLRGTWNFSSGCGHCGWTFLGGIVENDGVPEHYTFLVPASDYKIVDVWHVVGLAGTGSNDIQVEDAFVPAHRAMPTMPTMLTGSVPGHEVNSSAIYRLPYASVFSNAITCSAIGIALGAIEEYREFTRRRIRVAYGEQASSDPHAQIRLAEAAGEVDGVRLQLHRNMDELMAHAEAGTEIPLELRARIRRDQVRGTQVSIRATDRVFENCGGKALFLHQPIQRAWRDVHAARVHAVNDTERGLLMYGGHELEGEIKPGSMV